MEHEQAGTRAPDAVGASPAAPSDGGGASTSDRASGRAGRRDATRPTRGEDRGAFVERRTSSDADRRSRDRRPGERWQLSRALPIGLGVLIGIVLSEATLAVVPRLRSVFTLVLVSLFLSFAIEPAVQYLDRRGVRRGLGTALVYLGGIVLAVGFVLSFSGLVSSQVSSLATAAPTLLDDIADQADRLPDTFEQPVQDFLEEQAAELPDRLTALAGDLGRRAIGFGTTVLGGVFSMLTIALLTFYLVADGPRLRWQLLRRVGPQRQRELVELWELAIAKTGGYVYSRLVLAIVSALVHLVFFTLLGLPYAAALGVWMGLVSSVVPVVGLYIAMIVPVVVGLAEPGVSVILIVVGITIYQQLENYIVQPRITAHTLSLHPAVAFLAVLIGAALLGAIGALLALPAAAIVAALISTYAEEHEVIDHVRRRTDQEPWPPDDGTSPPSNPEHPGPTSPGSVTP